MPRRNSRFQIQRLSQIGPIAVAIDLAYGKRGYHGLADEFKRSYGLARDWQYNQQTVPTRVLVRLIQQLEAGGIIEKEYREAVAAAELEATLRSAALVRALEVLRSLKEERSLVPDKRYGRLKPETRPKRKSVKVLSEPE